MMELAPVLLVLLAQVPGSQDAAPAPGIEPPQPAPPWMLDVARDGSRVAVARQDGFVELWDPLDLKPLEVLEPALGSTPWAIALSPNGSRLAVLGHGGQLATWDLAGDDEDPSEPEENRDKEDWPRVLAASEKASERTFGADLRWTPDGERIVLVDCDGNAVLCDSTARVESRWAISPAFGTASLAFTSNGQHVLTSRAERVEVRSTVTGREAAEDAGLRSFSTGSEVVALAVHPTRDLLVTGHDRRQAVVWDLSTREVLREHDLPDEFWPEDEDLVTGAAFSPDGRFLALSISEGSFVYLIDVDTGEMLWTSEFLGAHFHEPMNLAWSPDSSRVWYAFACGGGDLGSHAVSADARAATYRGRGAVPRFGGEVALTVAWTEDGALVMPMHPRR